MAAAQILPLPELSPADELQRAERRRIIDSALGTTLAEGVSPGPELIAMSERYVAGEITLLELGTAVRIRSKHPCTILHSPTIVISTGA